MMKIFRLFLGAMLLLSGWGCSTEFDPTAEPKDIWVVYGVLNPGDTVQYIRISKAFLPESDAFVYARENDQSVPGLLVTLTHADNGREYIAEQVDSVLKQPEDGLFYPYQTLYKIQTIGNDRLEEGATYHLSVREPGNESFELRASTDIPSAPDITSPAIQRGAGGTRCLIQASLESPFTLSFDQTEAAAYEVRVYLDYTANGEPRQAVFGPTRTFDEDVRCIARGGVCYRFDEGTVLRSFLSQIDPQPNVDYRYAVTDATDCKNNADDLPRSLRFEVTSMDHNLLLYQQVNTPRFAESNTLRNQYTNVEANGDVLTLGVLASYQAREAIAKLSPCGEFLLGLNQRSQPTTNCEL
jgi:hypothetical protein